MSLIKISGKVILRIKKKQQNQYEMKHAKTMDINIFIIVLLDSFCLRWSCILHDTLVWPCAQGTHNTRINYDNRN